MKMWIHALALGAALASGASAAADVVWKASVWGTPRLATEPLHWYAKEVAAKTGGQLKIELVYRQSKPTDALELIKSGASDAAYFCSSYFSDKMPLTTVLDLPLFAPDTMPVLSRVQLALSEHPAIQAELRHWNIKMLLPMPLPQFQLMSTRRIAKVEDFKGIRVRISPETGKILEEYGAIPRMMSGAETVDAVKNGNLDAVALSYPLGFATFNIQQSTKYVTDNISLGTQLCYFGANQKSWDALPPHVQKIMLDLRRPALTQAETLYARDDAAQIAAFKQSGLEFVSFGAPDRARLIARAVKVWNAWVEEREKQGMKGREVFEFVQAKIREFGRK